MNIFMKLAAAAVITFTAAVGFAGESASAYELQRHTQQQIRERFEQLDIDIHDVTEYSQAYTDSSPYRIGSPSDEARQQALDALNFVRYVAGLPDDVELDDDLNYKAQNGSMVLYLNQAISHTPPKPDGLPQSIYDVGYEAYNTGDYEVAIENLSRAYQFDPSNGDALYYLAQAYNHSGDETHAIQMYRKVTEEFPDTEKATKSEGYIQQLTGSGE